MNTTELFNFRFVDREHERDIITNFLIIKKKQHYGLKALVVLEKPHSLIICLKIVINMHYVI